MFAETFSDEQYPRNNAPSVNSDQSDDNQNIVETEFHAKEKYRDIIKILLKSSDIESQLVSPFTLCVCVCFLRSRFFLNESFKTVSNSR